MLKILLNAMQWYCIGLVNISTLQILLSILWKENGLMQIHGKHLLVTIIDWFLVTGGNCDIKTI